jgi:hypothetical protein
MTKEIFRIPKIQFKYVKKGSDSAPEPIYPLNIPKQILQE